MKKKRWEIGILLSSRGFEGVQFFNGDPKIQHHCLKILPKLREILCQLDETIKALEG